MQLKANILSQLICTTVLLRTNQAKAESCNSVSTDDELLDLPSKGFDCTSDKDNICQFKSNLCHFWTVRSRHKIPPIPSDFQLLPCSAYAMGPEQSCWVLDMKSTNPKVFPVFDLFKKRYIIYCGPQTKEDSAVPKYLETQAKALYGEKARKVAGCTFNPLYRGYDWVECNNVTSQCF